MQLTFAQPDEAGGGAHRWARFGDEVVGDRIRQGRVDAATVGHGGDERLQHGHLVGGSRRLRELGEERAVVVDQ